MRLQHKVFGEVAPLEASFYLGQRVLITRCGNGDARNIFVGDSRWHSPIAVVVAEWERLKGYASSDQNLPSAGL